MHTKLKVDKRVYLNLCFFSVPTSSCNQCFTILSIKLTVEYIPKVLRPTYVSNQNQPILMYTRSYWYSIYCQQYGCKIWAECPLVISQSKKCLFYIFKVKTYIVWWHHCDIIDYNSWAVLLKSITLLHTCTYLTLECLFGLSFV